MSITAQEIQEAAFEHSRRGYDMEEVDVFLERVAEEVDVLCMQNQELRARVAELQAQLQKAKEAAPAAAPAPSAKDSIEVQETLLSYENQIRDQAYRIQDLEQQLAEKSADASAISAAIISAQKSADSIRAEARVEGEKIYRDAENKAREIIRDALTQKQQVILDLARLKGAQERFRNEYMALIKRFAIEGDKELSSDIADAVLAPEDLAAVNAAQNGELPAIPAPALAPAPAPAPAAPAPQQRYAAPAGYKSRYAAPAPQQQRVADFSGFGETDDDFGVDDLD